MGIKIGNFEKKVGNLEKENKEQKIKIGNLEKESKEQKIKIGNMEKEIIILKKNEKETNNEILKE